MRVIQTALLGLLVALPALPQTDAEKSKLEITGSFWRMDTAGTLQAAGTPLNLQTDLGVKQAQSTFTGKLVFKPGRKHKILVEGTPYRLDGAQALTRTVTYQGQTYNLNDRITSKASVDSVYGGYQYDFVSNPMGHLGFNVGAAYLNAAGSVTSTTTNVTASKSITVGLPLAGVEFRVFPVRKKILVEFNGEVKGMALGSYGRFVQATGNVGVGWGPILFEAGYRIADFDLHSGNSTTIVAPRFTGPIFSVVFRIP